MFNHARFYQHLVQHLRERSGFLRSLSVMAAAEHWVQFEAAALLDARRADYGLRGGTEASPAWWIACERRKVDIWLQGPDSAAAIELKAIHNNKNFDTKLAELRADLSDAKPVPRDGNVARFGIFVGTYARYTDSRSTYRAMRTQPRGPYVTQKQFIDLLRRNLETVGDRKEDQLRLAKMQPITSLDGSPYIESGHGSGVWLGLVEVVRSSSTRKAA